MEVRYKKDIDHNYLILKCTGEVNYETTMMLNNRINGLLSGSKSRFNGCTELYYDITSRQPLSRIYAKRELVAEDIKGILMSVRNLFEELKRYFLSVHHIIYDVDYCYCNPESRKPEWIFYPEEIQQEGIRKLAEFLIDRVNHEDKKAVDLSYQFYKLVKENELSIKELDELLEEYQEEDKPDCINHQEDEDTYISMNCPAESKENVQPGLSSAEGGKWSVIKRKLEEKLFELLGKKEGVKQQTIRENNNYSIRGNQNIRDRVVEKNGRYLRNESKDYSYDADWEYYGSEPDTACEGETVVMGIKNTFEKRQLRNLSGRGERLISLERLPCVLGKMEECADVVLKDPGVSRMHARIFEENGEIYLQDLNSRNGSFINNLELEANEIVKLKVGDEVAFGNLRYIFE